MSLLQIDEKATVATSQTENTIDELKFAHRWILRKEDLFENEWVTKMFDHGIRFATHFSNMFPVKQAEIKKALLESKPEHGDPHNWFWMWWKFKWMQDDWEYINDKVYNQPISYEHFKSYMLHCEILEQDLLSLIQSKKII